MPTGRSPDDAIPALNRRKMIDLSNQDLYEQLPKVTIIQFVVYEIDEMHGEPWQDGM
jgi:hypothetical protein